MKKYIKTSIPLFAAVSIFALALTSCGRRAGNTSSGAVRGGIARNLKMAAPQMMADAVMADMAAPMEMAMEAPMGEAFDGVQYGSSADGGVAASSADVTTERKLIHSANITIEVSDMDAAEKAVNDEITSLKGYAAAANRSDNSLSVDIKVPAASFDTAVDDVAGMGKLINKNVSAQDVTDRYYDLDSRIRTKRILKERLESYLKESANMKDLVAVETQLNNVISDLESMTGQFKRLANQIDYASISVRFILPTGKTERGWKWPSVSGKVRGFVVGAAGFFTTLALVILGIALFGTPVVLLAALLYCLTFGKVGWVKRLFKRMKGTKQE